MRIIVYDLGDKQHRLQVDWTTWRATLELLSRDKVVEKSELNRLVWRYGGAGTSIPESEARTIAEYLGRRLVPGEDVRVDGAIEFDGTKGALLFRDPGGVWLRSDWLEEFAVFCRTSQGIGAVGEGVVDVLQDDTFANSWVQAWNQRDLDAVLSHYADDVEFQSPLVVKLLGEPTGTVHGKQNLREYFRKALAAFPGDLQIVLLGTYRGVNSRLVHFDAKGRKAVEVMELDGTGKVRRAMTLGQL